MDWIKEINDLNGNLESTLSFEDFMNVFQKNSYAQLRTTNLYLKDMFNYFGKDENGKNKLLLLDHPDASPVYGQDEVLDKIYQNLINFNEEGFNNKFLLLVGPNGSSKSSLVRKLIKAMEIYSKSDEGALYSFSWIFPLETYVKGTLGLSGKKNESSLETYAYLEDQEISAILNSELRDHPLLLLPLDSRRKMIESNLKNRPELLHLVKKTFYYNGDLSKKNRLIVDALLKNYKGDYKKLFKHIRVERFVIDRRHSTAASTIEPQMHVDAHLQQITMDRRLANLPPSLQSLNLFNLGGEIVLANRGVLEFSDLLKRPLDSFKYLLTTMETKNINLGGITTELDIFFIGNTNEVHYTAFKQHPDFNSFKGRFNFIKVPYLVNYLEESKIYQEQISNLKNKTTFEPHSISALTLWSVMSRLRQCQPKNYKNKKLSELVAKMGPLDKALFLAHKTVPDFFTHEERMELNLGFNEIKDEFKNDTMYEGKFGISPRDVKGILYDLASTTKNITFIDIFEYLHMLVEKKNEHDFLNIGSQGDFHNAKKFVHLLEEYFLNIFDSELRESIGLVDNRSYESYIEKYIQQINALIKGEKIKNNVKGVFEDPDAFLIREFENNLGIKEDADQFRSHLISRLGAFSLDHPGKKLIYVEILSDIVKKLKESFRNEQKKIIQKVAQNIVFYISEAHHTKSEGESISAGMALKANEKKQIQDIINNLCQKFNYSEQAGVALLQYLIKNKYEVAS